MLDSEAMLFAVSHARFRALTREVEGPGDTCVRARSPAQANKEMDPEIHGVFGDRL
jgi:hypothetical protein